MRRPLGRRPLAPERVSLSWPGSVYESWAKKFVHKNFWQVREEYLDRADAMQECAEHFYFCLQRYGNRVDGPAHFMALYKLRVTTKWANAAYKASARRAATAEIAQDVDFSDICPVVKGDAEVYTSMSGASSELRAVLKIIAGAPAEVLDLLMPDPVKVRSDTTLNKAWRRVASLKETGANLVTELRGLLS